MEDKILSEELMITFAFVPREKVKKYLKNIDPKYLLTREEIQDNFFDNPPAMLDLLKNGYTTLVAEDRTKISGIPVKVTKDLLFKTVEELYAPRKQPRTKRVAKGV